MFDLICPQGAYTARATREIRVCHTLGENFTRGLRRQPVSLFQDQGSLYFTESQGKRRTNPVVDGQLVPRETHKRGGKRHREEPAAADVPPPTRARRARRAVDYAAMEDSGLEDEGEWSD